MADTLYPRRRANCPTSASGLRPTSMTRSRPSAKRCSRTAPFRPRQSSSSRSPSRTVTQCPYCIKGHTKAALRAGASREELMEAIWVAAEMRAGGAYAHSILAIEDIERVERRTA